MSNRITNLQEDMSMRLQSFWRRVLLVPEALICVALLIAAVLVEHPFWVIGLTITTALLIIRIGALYVAQSALAAARYREAASLAHLAYLMYPWSADALAMRGAIALTTGSLSEAVALLKRAIHYMPDLASTHAALSGALLALGRADSARLAAEDALILDSQCATAYLLLAEAEQVSGVAPLDVEDTLRAGLAVARRPEDEAALRCALAALLIGMGRQAESSLVLSGIERVLSLCSPASQNRLRMRYGELLIAQGQIERAREYLQGTIVVEQAIG
ncbi:MAG: hypothetical protein Fur005_22850 [Roseiflexaceae bacterium]